MNSKEAIKMLRTIQETVYLGSLKFYEAIDVAIKTLERPEVIRCKNCKYHRYEHDKTGDIPYCSRADYGYGWKDKDFCSRAERKDGEK